MEETKNRPPFILQLGQSFYILADNAVFVKCTHVLEALYSLMCCYYVFHIHFSKEVLPSLTFLQREILGDKVDDSPGATVLLFVKQLISYSESDKDFAEEENSCVNEVCSDSDNN